MTIAGGWRRRTPALTLGIALPALALGIAVLAIVAPAAALDVPSLGARVNDLARVLSPAARDRLESTLRDLERQSGAQVAVLTIPSLAGESLEDYSVRVAQTWKLGRKGADDGVLFLVVTQDRKMRIEVGYGLEARLTDLITRRILDEQVRPRFRRNDFDGGIEAGVGAIAAVIAGQPLPASRPSSSFRHVGSIGGLLFGIAIFTVVIGAFSLLALFMPGFFGWFLYVFLMFFYAAFPTQFFPPYGGVVACGAWIIAFPILRSWLRPWSKDFDKRHPTLAGVAASGGHGSGGRWSGGGGGGGGFSGGGGSFGGGGSSSSW